MDQNAFSSPNHYHAASTFISLIAMNRVAVLGTGLIGRFYTMSIQHARSADHVSLVYSRKQENADAFAKEWDIPHAVTDWKEAVSHPEVDLVVVGLPNNLHKEVILAAAQAGKGILCTKPLAMNGEEALEILNAVEAAGVFHGYLEDLAYTPKTLKALDSIKKGAIGQVLWARSREAHPGPHSDWFWDSSISGGGAIIDIGCHCIEVTRNFIGKDIRPVEVMCWADTLVKPIEAEDHAIALIKYENGAISQFEVSWAFRGGMDLRDEVAGTDGTIRLDHFFHTGYEMFTAGGTGAYVAEKSESEQGWMFPVGDELHALGYNFMFQDMFESYDEGKAPFESFYDGYIVNSIMDACYKSAESRQWEPVNLPLWRGQTGEIEKVGRKEYDADHWLMTTELMPDGKKKVVLKHKETGQLSNLYL